MMWCDAACQPDTFWYCSVHAARWKNDKPMSRQAFDARFSDEEACAHHLAQHRRPEGFVCPSCGTCKGWPLKRNRATWECAGCARQTSVTAGTVMHSSHLPLRTWFLAAHIITSHSNGMSALQLQAQPGLGSCKTAWLLLQKLRRSMVNPDRNPLKDLVEIDETEMQFRSRHDPEDRSKVGAARSERCLSSVPSSYRVTDIRAGSG